MCEATEIGSMKGKVVWGRSQVRERGTWERTVGGETMWLGPPMDLSSTPLLPAALSLGAALFTALPHTSGNPLLHRKMGICQCLNWVA